MISLFVMEPSPWISFQGLSQMLSRFFCGNGDIHHGLYRDHDSVCLACTVCMKCGYQINPTKQPCPRLGVHSFMCYNENCSHEFCQKCQFYCCNKTDCHCFRCTKKDCQGDCECYNCKQKGCDGQCNCKTCGLKLIPGHACPCNGDDE